MHPLVGHVETTRALARAHLKNALPSCLLLHGAPGVGKQRLALWTAQLILCENPGPEGPCGSCKPCALSGRIEHPDLHWYFPLPRPRRASSPEKLGEMLEEARQQRLAELRDEPLQPSVASEDPTGLYLAIARSLRSRAQRRPAMGNRQIFIVAEAETLVPQEASQEAANALLKLLEEPPDGTTLILTSNQPGRLLDTIRSRTLPLHVSALPRDLVRDFLVSTAGVEESDANRAAELAGGSIGRALGFVPDEDEPGPLEALRQDAFRLLQAALSRKAGPGYRHALGTPRSKARTLIPLLEFVEMALRDLATVASGSSEATLSTDAIEFLQRRAQEHDLHPSHVAGALRHVEEAKEMAAGNVNPQLIVGGLVIDLRRALLGATSGKETADVRR